MDKTEAEAEAFAIGYFYGRSIGSDEPLEVEMVQRYGEHDRENDVMFFEAKQGYMRGVSDFCEFDEG